MSLFSLIDVRPDSAFVEAHAPDAANVPLEELPGRVHELPAREVSLRVTDADSARAAQARAFLESRGHVVEVVPFDAVTQTEAGPSRVRLWSPSPFLIDSMNRIERERPPVGLRALDVACGTGRDAVYMALRGCDVTAVDLLPDALARAQDLARRNGVGLRTIRYDLESTPPSLPAGSYDLVTVFRYLHRPLFPSLAAAVSPGGYVIYETFHERNLQTGRRPHNAAHLLGTGELPRYFPKFEVLLAADAVERDGRFFSHLLARRNVR